ncbi:copper-binding protein [Variovorax gossypii]
MVVSDAQPSAQRYVVWLSPRRRHAFANERAAPMTRRDLTRKLQWKRWVMAALAFPEIRNFLVIDHRRQFEQCSPSPSMRMKNAACASILAAVCAIGLQEVSATPIEARMELSPATSPQGKAPDPAYSTGQVKRVDWDQGKVLISHGPIENLGMPGMTMLFRVSERSLLRNLNNGDRIQFKAEKANGTLFVVEIVRQ